MGETIYQCCKCGKDVNKTLSVVHCADTEAEALKWLEDNGGGVYRNILHRIKFEVKAVDKKNGS